MKKTTILSLTLLCSSFLFGQQVSDPQVYKGDEMWFLLLNRYDINEKWTVGNEFHLRRHDYFSEQKQLLLRPWVDYHAAPGFTASFGYSYIRTSPHGVFDVGATLNEHNIWEQITLDHSPWDFLNFSHRLRLEHRWSEIQPDQGDEDIPIDFRNRFRYRLTAKVRLSEKWYAHIFDESWVNVNEGIHVSSFDRNWIYVGAGYNFTEKVALELAYLDQWDNYGSLGYHHNTGLQMTMIWDFD